MENKVSHREVAREVASIRVLVADESPIVREGLSSLLAQQPGIELVAKVRDAASIIQIIELSAPDVILLDLAPPVSEAIQNIGKILAIRPAAKIVVFSNSFSEEHIYESMQVGAKSYLHKTSSLEDIVACIRAIAIGQKCIPQSVMQVLARRCASPSLTRREQDVLKEMATGKSNRQIGEALQMSEGTVKVHVTHILEKLKVAGRTEALAIAAVRGLVSLQFPSVRSRDSRKVEPHSTSSGDLAALLDQRPA